MNKYLFQLLIIIPVYSQSDLNVEVFAPNIISTGHREVGSTFSPDGKTVYFSKWAPDFSLAVICSSKFIDDEWTKPEIANFSGQHKDQHPFLAPDGNTLLFVSQRPLSENGKRQNYDIWKVNKTDTGWSPAINLGPVINSSKSEYSPSMTRSGKLYWASSRDGSLGGADIYYVDDISTSKEVNRINSVQINSQFAEWHVYVNADDNQMFFTSLNRDGGTGEEDLYFSEKIDGIWTVAKELPVNSKKHDYLASISPDKQYFYFTSEQTIEHSFTKKYNYDDFMKRIDGPQNGQMDIYRVDYKKLLQSLH